MKNVFRVLCYLAISFSTLASLQAQANEDSVQAKNDLAKPKENPAPAKDWEVRSIVDYHQAGASSAKFSQNFFFDFFAMRALSSKHLWDGKWSSWGDVRIASFPQQVTTGVGKFASNFTTQVSSLPVNQLALSADFQTGLEYRVAKWNTLQDAHRMLGAVAYFGALGAFEPPDAQMQIFTVPDKSSLQYPTFAKEFRSAANAKFVGFVPPDRERFFRSYGVGFRMTSFSDETSIAPPTTYTVTFGQDEAVTEGALTSVVSRIDAFQPLPVGKANGNWNFLYLFGTANLRLSKARSIPALALQNPNANGVTVQPFDPNLAVVTLPNTRDTYRIGVGMDLINFIRSIGNKNP